MRYESRPAPAPDLRRMSDAQAAAILRARAAWHEQNPWRPVDWKAVAEQQKGASDAMREGERTQRDVVLQLNMEKVKAEASGRFQGRARAA